MPTRQNGRYTLATAQAVLDRLAAGEPLTRICRDEKMPGLSAVYRWIRTRPGFRQGYVEARAAAAEGLAAEALEAARAVTPKDATAKRVLLGELRWQAERLATRDAGDLVGATAGAPDDLATRLERALRRAAAMRSARRGQG